MTILHKRREGEHPNKRWRGSTSFVRHIYNCADKPSTTQDFGRYSVRTALGGRGGNREAAVYLATWSVSWDHTSLKTIQKNETLSKEGGQPNGNASCVNSASNATANTSKSNNANRKRRGLLQAASHLNQHRCTHIWNHMVNMLLSMVLLAPKKYK